MFKDNIEDVVSVIMPAYNAGQYIKDSILSLQQQKYKNWELIVVDDGSTDNTASIVKQLQAQDNRIKYVYQQNKRLGAARNTGISHATGEWIAFLDADDLWEPAKLKKQIDISRKHPHYELIFTDGWIFFNNDLNKLTPYNAKTGVFTAEQMYKIEYEWNFIPVLSVMVKRNVVLRTGNQEEGRFFHGCEDWDYWLRIAKEGVHFYGIAEKLFYYRRHDNNMSGNNLNMDLASTAVLLKNFDHNILSSDLERKRMEQRVYSLILNLLKNDRTTDADYIVKQHQQKFPTVFNKTMILLLENLEKHAMLPMKLSFFVKQWLNDKRSYFRKHASTQNSI